MTLHFRRRLVATTFLATLSVPIAAFAQAAAPPSASGSTLAEIVVTAQHRAENLQRAALSATVATGDTLIERGINDSPALSKLVPGLNITPNVGYTAFNVRGITSGGSIALSDPSIAVNYNQVSLAFVSSAAGLYYDLERVELVNGPQGILYGRNSTAGAINVVAARPSLSGFSGNVGADYGNYNQINGRAMVNIPLNDKLAFRFAGQTVNHDGYYSDGTGDQHDNAARFSFLAKPNDDLTVYLSGDYAQSNDKGGGATFQYAQTDPRAAGRSCNAGFCFIASPRTGLQELGSYLAPYAPRTRDSYSHNKYWGVSADIDWRTPYGTLTVIPAYRGVSAHDFTTSTSFGSFRELDDPTQASLEVRMQSPQDWRLKYQAGFYALSTDVKGIGNGETNIAGTFSANFYKQTGYSYAPFAQLTFSVTDKFRIVGGVRYTYDQKSTDSWRYTIRTVGPNPNLPDALFPPPPVGPNPIYHIVVSKHWDATTWKGGVEWDIASNSFLYANASTGFKAGGFFFGPPGYNFYNPETVTAYMGGIKNRFLDNRMQVNLEGFYYDYNNQQLAVNVLVPLPDGTNSNVATTQNVGHSHIQGAELDVDWRVLKDTQISLHTQWTDGSYNKLSYIQSTIVAQGSACTSAPVNTPQGKQFSVDCSGHSVVGIAKWAVNGSVQQTFEMPNGAALVAEADARYQGPRFTTTLYTPGSLADAVTVVDATLQYRPASGKWNATAFVNDIAGGDTVTGRAQDLGIAKNGIYFATIRSPRTFGVRLNRYF